MKETTTKKLEFRLYRFSFCFEEKIKIVETKKKFKFQFKNLWQQNIDIDNNLAHMNERLKPPKSS